MTTGTIGTGYSNLILSTGDYTYKNWSGTDGHYETYHGKKRVKFNDYIVHYSHRYRGGVKAYFIRQDYGDPNPYTDYVYLPIGGPEPAFAGWPTRLVWSNNDILDIMSKLVTRVKSHDFNLAVNVAQGHQLVDMVSSNLRKLTRAVLALKKGNFALAARQFGTSAKKNTSLKTTDISGRWLELQYGWLPALSDTFEAAKAFEAISSGPRKSTFSAKKKREDVSKTNNGVVTWWWDTYAEYRIKFELAEEMSVERQLGLLDPLSVAWEVVPYSFVVDWFIPIGTYLSVLSQIPYLKGRFVITDYKRRKGPYMKWSSPHEPFVVGPVSLPSDDSGLYIGVTRSCSDELHPPTPRFSDGLSGSPKRIANAIALAYQAFTGSSGFTSRGRSL